MSIPQFLTSVLLSLLLLTSSAPQPKAVPTSPPHSPVVASPTPLPNAASSDTSRNWAGYSATNGTFTGVSGTWTIPHVQPMQLGADEADATWVGIGGLMSTDLIQAGTQASTDSSGHIEYEVFYETLPDASQGVNLLISPGDTIHIDLIRQSDSLWKATIQNVTSGNSIIISIPYHSSYSSAEWIEEAPSTQQRVLPLDDFGTITISHAIAVRDGQTLTAAQLHATALSIKSFNNTIVAQASILDKDGASFTVSRTPFLVRRPMRRRIVFHYYR